MNQSLPAIEQVVIDMLQSKMGIDKKRISLQAHLMRGLGLDSLDAVELIVEVEKQFDITISDEELEEIVTLHDLIACIQEKLSVDG